MSATLAETYFSEREARAHDAAGLFDATRDSGCFVDQLKVWMGRTDLPGRANVEMRYLFRGHADSRWGLSSTLYRTVTSAGGAYDERLLRQAERAIVKQMRSEGLGRNLTDGEMLIVLQHHAIPTRLIDTTESPRVALHFACAGQDGVDGRLFVLAQRQAANGEFPSTALKDSQLLPWGVKRPRGPFALSRWQEAVVCVDDDPLDPRMKAQQGRFLVGGLIRRLAGDGISVVARISRPLTSAISQRCESCSRYRAPRSTLVRSGPRSGGQSEFQQRGSQRFVIVLLRMGSQTTTSFQISMALAGSRDLWRSMRRLSVGQSDSSCQS